MTNGQRQTLVLFSTLTLISSQTNADFVSYTDFGEWSNAAGAFHEILFDEFPAGTPLNEQYSDLGVIISGSPPAFISTNDDADGFQMQSSGDIFLDFNFPQFEFGIDYPANILIELFYQDEQVYIENFFITDFVGVVSDQPFDSVRLSRIVGPPVFADNIYFTVPAPGTLVLFGMAGFMPGGRRRRRIDR